MGREAEALGPVAEEMDHAIVAAGTAADDKWAWTMTVVAGASTAASVAPDEA